MNNTISKKKKKTWRDYDLKGNEPDFYLTQPQEQKRSCFMKEQSFNSQLIKKKKNKEWNEGFSEERHLSNWISTGTQSFRLAFQLFQSSSSNL